MPQAATKLNQMVDDSSATWLIMWVENAQDIDLDQIFAALADPTRRAILKALLERNLSVADLAAPFAMSLTAVSKHISLLIESGLISRQKRGRERICSLDPLALSGAFDWMQSFGHSQDDALEALELRLFELDLLDDKADAPEQG